MLIEPIELELDKPRKFFLSVRALMRAETEINRRRGIPPAQHVSLDHLMWKAATNQVAGVDGTPLDLLASVLWAGIIPDEKEKISFDDVLDMMDTSPLTRGQILTRIWNHYNDATLKRKPGEAVAEGDGESLGQRPGATSGVLQ